MIECPLCFIEVEDYEMTTDPDFGECCVFCHEEFQNDRDMEHDYMRKAWKSGEITDEEYEEYEC